MSEQQEGKKISLAEAAKQLLAQKKQAQSGKGKPANNAVKDNVKQLKSQISKKANNQSRRTGV